MRDERFTIEFVLYMLMVVCVEMLSGNPDREKRNEVFGYRFQYLSRAKRVLYCLG